MPVQLSAVALAHGGRSVESLRYNRQAPTPLPFRFPFLSSFTAYASTIFVYIDIYYLFGLVVLRQHDWSWFGRCDTYTDLYFQHIIQICISKLQTATLSLSLSLSLSLRFRPNFFFFLLMATLYLAIFMAADQGGKIPG